MLEFAKSFLREKIRSKFQGSIYVGQCLLHVEIMCCLTVNWV